MDSDSKSHRTSDLINGDCLIELKNIKDKSIDFVYLDLPYGQTACEWDKKLDLKSLWIELRRIAKNDRTPFFFSCTTKFGFELFNNSPKGFFRWDLVWEKNRAAGFLNAYKLPMRKHEMIYCFAKKTPEYDVSSHSEYTEQKEYTHRCNGYGKDIENKCKAKTHKDPLPTSVLPPQEDHELVYCFAKKTPEYDVSSHLSGEEIEKPPSINHKYLTQFQNKGSIPTYEKPHKSKVVNDPLPTSVLPPQEDHELVYCFAKKTPEYDVSSHNEYTEETGRNKEHKIETYGKKGQKCVNSKTHKDRLPTSILDIPSSWCKINLDEKINHRTSKPVKLMEFLLKYWSKEGDTILDPTAGSGSMGIACKNMNRKFIGIEKDTEIFKIMEDRINNHLKK